MGRDSGVGSHGAELKWKRDHILTALREVKAESILDLGCGDGAVANAVLASASASYLGVDQAEFPGFALPFQYGDLTSCDLPRMDLVLLLDVLMHLSTRERHDRVVERLPNVTGKLALVMVFIGTREAPHVLTHPFEVPQGLELVKQAIVPQSPDKRLLWLKPVLTPQEPV